MRLSKRSVFYNVFSLTISNIVLQILGFLYRIILSRLIGAQGMGVFQLVSPYYSVILAISLSGLTMAVSQISAEHTAFRDIPGARRAVKISFCLFALLFCCVAVPTAVYSEPISRVILGDARTRAALLIFLPCLLGTGVENILKNYFFGTNFLKPPIISELTEQTVRIISVAALLIYFKPGDAGSAAALIALGMVVSEVVSSVLLCGFYRAYAPRLSPRRAEPAPAVARRILSIAVPVAFSALLNNLLSSLNSVLIPRRLVAYGMASDAAISLFGTLFGMTMPLLTFPIAFIAPLTTVTVPKLSEGVAVNNFADVRRKAGKAIHATGLLAFPAIAVLIPLGAPACTLIYGQESAGAYMLPLCIATLFGYYQITTTAVLNGIGKQRRAACIILAIGVIELGFTWSIGYIGIRGFLIGHIVSSAAAAVLNLKCAVRALKLRMRWRNWFFTPFISACLAGVSADLMHKLMLGEGNSQLASLVISLLCATAIYLLALSAQGTRPSRYLRTLIPRSQR